MDADADRRALLARAWDEAAPEYERYFVPRFAPWVATAVRAVTEAALPPGPILVPCCGTFPELPALVASQPDREIVGVELSAGMVRLARQRAAGSPRARVIQGDAVELDPQWMGTCAAVVSVFGLQQLPDPQAAMATWISALRPGGRLSVMYWPAGTEQDGPYALLDRVLAGHRPPSDAAWPDRLSEVVTAAGGIVERDEYRAFPIEHPDAETFWTAMVDGGPLHSLAITRGKAFIRARGREFLAMAPRGPWRHQPQARWIVAHRQVAASASAATRAAVAGGSGGSP